jgi:hypothetical protein
MPDYNEFHDARLKHLEMLQAVIARLGTNGFVVKGWAITVAGAFFGFAVSELDWRLAIASTIPTGMFWILDTYFLRSERLFRLLYERVRTSASSVEPFSMNATDSKFVDSLNAGERRASSTSATFWRPTLRLLYGGLLVVALIVAVSVGFVDEPPAPMRWRAHP